MMAALIFGLNWQIEGCQAAETFLMNDWQMSYVNGTFSDTNMCMPFYWTPWLLHYNTSKVNVAGRLHHISELLTIYCSCHESLSYSWIHTGYRLPVVSELPVS